MKAFHSLFVGVEISVVWGSNEGRNNGIEHSNFSLLEVVLKIPSNEGEQSAVVELRLPLSQYHLNGASADDMMLQSSKEHSISETFVILEQ